MPVYIAPVSNFREKEVILNRKKKKVLITASDRISRLPPYLFAEMDRQEGS